MNKASARLDTKPSGSIDQLACRDRTWLGSSTRQSTRGTTARPVHAQAHAEHPTVAAFKDPREWTWLSEARVELDRRRSLTIAAY